MADTGDIRKGLCMDYNNDIYVVTDFQHVKPARGAAFVRTTMKSMTSGKSVENTLIRSQNRCCSGRTEKVSIFIQR
jgi:elongation factor P